MPPWLRRTYPETTARTATGVEQPYGVRQDIDYSHPAFRHLAERLIRRIVERYRDHPAVIGWQVDNEPGLKLFYNHSVFQGFLEYLRDRYGDVDTLNTPVGSDLLVASAVGLGGSVGTRRQHHAVLRPGLAPLPGRS